jgi:hypothetical protein
MKNLFAYTRSGSYIGRVVESEMGTLDGYPQKFVTVLMPDGKMETKKETSWTYASTEEVLPVKKEKLFQMQERLQDLRNRSVKEDEAGGIEQTLGELGLLGIQRR